MIALGSVLVLVGFAIVLPRDGLPGSASRTVLRHGMHMFRTTGSRADPAAPDRPWPYALARVLIGLGVLALGVWVTSRGLDARSEPAR